MSPVNRHIVARLQKQAAIFAALGDETRLSLVSKLAKGKRQSILQLTEGSKLSRQAVTKHLEVLKNVGVVQSTFSGRENHFELNLHPFKHIQEYLEFVSQQWDVTLARLKEFVEK